MLRPHGAAAAAVGAASGAASAAISVSPDTLHTMLHAVHTTRSTHAHIARGALFPITHDLVRLGITLCIYIIVCMHMGTRFG